MHDLMFEKGGCVGGSVMFMNRADESSICPSLLYCATGHCQVSLLREDADDPITGRGESAFYQGLLGTPPTGVLIAA